MAQEDRAIHAGRLADIVVDVAVAEMTERHGPRSGNHQLHELIGARDKLRHARDRHGDVVLDAAAFLLLHLAHQLAQAPQLLRLRQRRRDHRAVDLAGLDALAKHTLGEASKLLALARARQLE